MTRLPKYKRDLILSIERDTARRERETKLIEAAEKARKSKDQ